MPVTCSEHVHEIPLTVGSTAEGPQRDNDHLYPIPENVHFATIEEKKRLWLRDAFINALFIASWYVKHIPTVIRLESFHLIMQVYFRTHTIFVQQMDVRS